MRGELTTELADKLDLPLNPFTRHRVVGNLLQDPRLVGDTHIVVNKRSFSTEGHRTTLSLTTINPLLGRSTLRKVARTIDFIEQYYEGEK